MVGPRDISRVYLDETDDPTTQYDLMMEPRKGKNDYPHELRIEYRCSDCHAKTGHDQHCIDWEIYQYWENHDDDEGVIDALLFNRDDAHHYFFVGNLNHERRAYIIISVIRFLEEDMLDAGVTVGEQTELSAW
jgi:hypothetical protein